MIDREGAISRVESRATHSSSVLEVENKFCGGTHAVEKIGSCIIIGGGAAGTSVATALKGKGVQVTIIDRQDYKDWSLASARMLANPDSMTKNSFQMPLDKVAEFLGAKFVHSDVKEIGEKSVTLVSGQVLTADCIVVAMGGQYSSGSIWKPLPEHTTKEKRIDAIKAEHERVAGALSIAIAGAGLTGVEVAGELKAAFPATSITLVGTLLGSSSTAAQDRVRKALEELNVAILPGRLEEMTPVNGTVTTTKGATIVADIVYNCAGFTFAVKNLLEDSLKTNVSSRGRLTCRSTLQFDGSDTVFACGDILEVPEGKFADIKGFVHADGTGKFVGENIINLLSKKSLSNFQWSDEPLTSPSFTVLGPNIGVGDFGMPSWMDWFGNFMCRKLKGQDFMSSMYLKKLGKGSTW